MTRTRATSQRATIVMIIIYALCPYGHRLHNRKTATGLPPQATETINSSCLCTSLYI